MTYRHTSDYDTDDPQELRRDLQQLDREIESAFQGVTNQPTLKTVRKITGSAAAQFDELLVVDMSGGNVTITLPQAANSKHLAGRVLLLVRTSASNTLTIACVGADTINRAASVTAAAAVGLVATVTFDGVEFWK